MPSEHPTLNLGELPRLAVRRPDGKEVQHWLAIREITIGRGLANRICIPDPHVSKFHAKLIFSDDSITLTDLGSTNKTRVNGQEVTESGVSYGDFIQIAHVECRLLPPKIFADAVPKPSPPSAPISSPPIPSSRPPQNGKHETALTVNLPPRRAAGNKAGAFELRRLATAPPRVRSPMFKLYAVGGVLILLSLLMALTLRILLTPEKADAVTAARSETATLETLTEAPEVDAPEGSNPLKPDGVAPSESEVAPGRSAEFYFDEALSLTAAGRLKAARANFEKTLEIEPTHRRAKSRLALLDEQIENEIEAHFTNARQAYQFLRYDEAIAEWEMVMELADTSDPRHEESLNGISEARAKKR